jgi:hypothetical protein
VPLRAATRSCPCLTRGSWGACPAPDGKYRLRPSRVARPLRVGFAIRRQLSAYQPPKEVSEQDSVGARERGNDVRGVAPCSRQRWAGCASHRGAQSTVGPAAERLFGWMHAAARADAAALVRASRTAPMPARQQPG